MQCLMHCRILVQVWGGEALQTVHAVEKAAPMLALGFSCQKALRAAGMVVPSVRWSRKLAPRPSEVQLVAQRWASCKSNILAMLFQSCHSVNVATFTN